MIRVGHDYAGRAGRRQRAVPPFAPRGTVTRLGIARLPRARVASGLPISERHELVLSALTRELTGASGLSARTGLSRGQVTAALYALADRGLVERVPYKGWRATSRALPG